MDESHTRTASKASGHSGSGSMRLPGCNEPFPRVDDHLVEPEVTRDEIIGGRRVVAFPALEPHAGQQSDLNYVLRAHVSPGYLTAAKLLTRLSQDSDFASDTCIYRKGIEPQTGQRHLEEIVFAVISEQSEQIVPEKAAVWHRRGVRRIFAVFVEGPRRVCEWSAESQSWTTLDGDTQIEDHCLVKPLPVAALLDAEVADNAVVQALAVKGNPALRRREAAAKAEWVARSILKVLEARGVVVSEAQREEILRCHDRERLDRWLARAALASSFGEITDSG